VAHHSIGQLRQPLARHDPVIIVGVRELEHIFCQIDCNSRSMHGGLLSFGQLNAALQFGTSMPIYRREESIQSFKRTAVTGAAIIMRHAAAAA